MKLYDYKAPNPRRVRIFLAEKNIEVPIESVDLRSGAQFSTNYGAVTDRAVVPLLELDDGTCISESIAICRYFEETQPEPPLFGATPVEKALVEMWNRRCELEGIQAAGEAFRNATPGFKDRALPGPVSHGQIAELAERGKKRTQHFFTVLDEQLAYNKFVAGEHYSVADISALVFVDFARWAKLFPADDQAHLKRWYEQISSRSSAEA